MSLGIYHLHKLLKSTRKIEIYHLLTLPSWGHSTKNMIPAIQPENLTMTPASTNVRLIIG